METPNNLNNNETETPLTVTGEPTDQLDPEENGDDTNTEITDSEFDNASMDDDDEDLDEDEVKRLFPGEDNFTEDEEDDEPYEGIRHGDGEEDEGLVDDNMSGMPVIPSPS